MALVDAYFAHNYILYPVVSEEAFRASIAERTTSPLLLSAVIYAGVLHAPDFVIHSGKFETREALLGQLYQRAKKLFFEEADDDGTGDQLARVQAAFLLHTMWPTMKNSVMNSWTWLGLAIRLAQDMGIHRRATSSLLTDSERKLRKRIWWSLFVSLIHLRTSGRPWLQ